ncbi:Hypothetical protein SMAX5B_015499 [Scophthalmus maximus]|uniref:Uncharacterized protein n=1 Tax=Scophthalmus maximus TaxID=52904 RepID=A0A2U9CYD8_SCOMX|nr:Hypothetical protein SMAX5B_015499 [Scophthalmus maximus]
MYRDLYGNVELGSHGNVLRHTTSECWSLRYTSGIDVQAVTPRLQTGEKSRAVVWMT